MNINEDIRKILNNRGFIKDEDIHKLLFLKASDIVQIETPDIEKAIQILKENKHIVIYGDYDCDGICASAIAKICLERLGKIVDIYINDRQTEGYGMQPSAIDNIMELYPYSKCILTVDNGISQHQAISYAKERGYAVVVTDHHEPGKTLPSADAVVDLKRYDDKSLFKELCGAGLIWKLMNRLYEECRVDKTVVYNCLDLAALATLADVVPLLEDNRAIVRDGLRLIDEGKRPFFRKICALTKVANPQNGTDVAFGIAPAINSLSRMGEDINVAFAAIIDGDTDAIQKLLDTNDERKALTAETYKEVKNDLIIKDGFVLAYGDYPEGIIGIIAGKLKEEYNRLAIVVTKGLKASLRGVDGDNVKELLDKIPTGVLKAYGGHSKAAGLTIVEGQLKRFVSVISKLTSSFFPLKNEYKYDLSVSEEKLTEDFVEELTLLEPFGEGFPPVQLKVKCKVESLSFMGEKKAHAKYTTKRGLKIVIWNGAERAKAHKKMPTCFIGTPSLNYFNGKNNVQLTLKC